LAKSLIILFQYNIESVYFFYTGCGRKKSPTWEANKFKSKEDTAVVLLFLESTQNAVLNLCRSFLKPYCKGRKTVFFFSGHLIYILKQERFRAFRPAGGV
jgi:CDGSH-type Zn-finger protein